MRHTEASGSDKVVIPLLSAQHGDTETLRNLLLNSSVIGLASYPFVLQPNREGDFRYHVV